MKKSFDEYSDLLIREQFLNTFAVEMAVFLKERVPRESVEETVRLAEQHMEARSWWNHHREDHKSFQKQRTEHKTDPKADRKAQVGQEKKCRSVNQ